MKKAISCVLFFIGIAFGIEHRITNANNFSAFANDVNKGTNFFGTTVFLDSDLFLSESYGPIGYSNQFRGVFNGQGHVISNLSIFSSSSVYTGLFGYSNGMIISNVVLDSSCSITSSYNGNYAYIGGIIGWCYAENSQHCYIENIINMASVTFRGTISGGDNRYLHLSGIVGEFRSDNYHVYGKNCANYGAVTYSGSCGDTYIGGFAGQLCSTDNYKYIHNFLNYGTITHNGTTSGTLHIGGVVGRSYSTYIENCVNAGRIILSSTASTNFIGTIAGHVVSNTYLYYCYYTDKLSNYNIYGYGSPTATLNTFMYNSTSFELNGTAFVKRTTKTSLIEALNAYSEYNLLNNYSNWILNKDDKVVSFTINNRINPIMMDHQIILLPSLAGEGNLSFDGWYTDNELTSFFSYSAITNDTELYGVFKEGINHTISFNTKGGPPIQSETVQYGDTVTLQKDLTKDSCTIAFWETEKGYNVGFSLVMPATNITLHAVWKCTHIKTPDDFLDFTSVVNAGETYSETTVFLDSDISLPKVVEPIGNSSNTNCQFSGVFNGQGHVISNLTILSSSSQYAGLFGYSTGITISDVVLDSSCSIISLYSGSNHAYAGGIIGQCKTTSNQCWIEDIINMASVTFRGAISGNYDLLLGGFVGEFICEGRSTVVKNCANYGAVINSGTCAKNTYIGGISGKFYNSNYNKYMYNCFNYGTLGNYGTTSEVLFLGGITGYSYYTQFNNCLSAGRIILSSTASASLNYLGSLIGQVGSETYLRYCYFTDDVKVTSLYSGGSATSIIGTYNFKSNLDSVLMDNLNERASSNSWNKWFFLHLNGGRINDVDQDVLAVTGKHFPVPVKDKMPFLFWCKDASCTEKYDLETSDTVEVSDLYAKWPTIVVVTLSVNGGNNASSSKDVIYNSTYGELPTPSRTGYTFAGWFTETPEGDLINFSTVVTLDYDHTIYAHWNPIKYTISFVSNGGSACPNTTQDYDTLIIFPKPSKIGYTFICWCNDTDLKKEYTAKRIESRNITLYARWVVNNYTISFDKKCKFLHSPMNVTYGSEYNLPEQLEGQKIIWWDVEETGERVKDGTIARITRDHTLCAVLETNSVSFDASGGDDDLEPVNITYGEKYENLTNATRTGYTFVGWFLNESSTEQITSKTKVTIPYPHTLYARWRINSYTVTFDPDNGENVDKSTLEYNSTVVYPKDPERRGHTFSGWDNDKFKFMPAENITITAQWVPNKYIVTLDVNGADDELVNKEMLVTFDSLYGTLPTPSKIGHTFAGWTDSLFGGNEISNFTTVSIPNNHTIYALWTVNQYTMTFLSEGMKPVNITLNYNDMIIYPSENPSKSFHKFRRWCTRGENGEEECNVTHVPDHNLRFTASFDVDTSFITGTAVGALAVILLIIFIIVIVFLIRFTRTVKHKYEIVGIELDEDFNDRNEDIEERIRQQVETTSISIDIKKKLVNPLKNADRNKGVEEILMDLEVDCENAGEIDIIDSYRTTNASVAVADAISNEKNIIAAAEYLTLLYTSVREQEEYEKFNELYFSMKDVNNFMNSMDEKTICFGGVVSGFTSKKVAIQSLIPRDGETASMPSGVLFRVQNGMGYRIGKVDKDTDEVLFELCSSFKIESMKEINKDKYIVVNLSFASPMKKNEMVNLK